MKTTRQILKLIKDNNFEKIKNLDISKKINTMRSVKIGGFTDDNGMNVYIKEQFSPFMFAVYKNNKKIVEHFLTKYKDDLNINLENKNGKTALILLMDRTKYRVGLDIFGLLLKHHNFDINYQNKNGETALMLAAENNSPIIKNLLKHKADPNSKDNNGETSLMKASRYGYFRIIKELVDHGANVNDTIKKSYFNVTKSAPVPNTEFTDAGDGYTYTVGTSNATAIITGVSALVWQAYPWMTNSNVQQTVLTTATHLSDDAVNPTASYDAGKTYSPNARYGWGLVDAERAVHGPGQFNGAFKANVGDYQSEFSNAIAGSGSLTLSGGSKGMLMLSADNTYSGGTVINSASLDLTGSLASSVTLNGGTLLGDGSVNSFVNNVSGAVYSVSSDPNKGLSIKGDYTAGQNSSTAIAIGNTLEVGGKSSLDGTLYVMPVKSDKYTPESTEVLLHSVAGVSGKFDTVNKSSLTMYDADVSYDADDVNAKITRKSVSTAVPQSSVVVAQTSHGLEKSLKQADAWSQSDETYAKHSKFLNQAAKFLSTPSKAMAQASVASLSGEIYGTSHTMEVLQAHHVSEAIATHQMVSDGRTGVWIQYLNNSGDLSKSGYASADYNGHVTLLGFDFKLNENANLGAFVGNNKSSNRMSGLSGHSREDGQLLGVYGSYELGKAYVSGNTSWSKTDMDVSRDLLLGTQTYTVYGSRTDHIGQLNLEVGRHFGFVTPYVGWSKLWLHQDGFAETGTNVNGVNMSQLALSSSSQSFDTSSATVGVRFNHDFDWMGNHSTLYGFVDYRKTLTGEDMGFKASFIGTPNSVFTASGQPLPDHMTQIGVSLHTDMNKHWSWYVGAQQDVSTSRYHAFSANAGLSYHF